MAEDRSNSKVVDLQELRARLDVYVRQIKAGGRITITEGGTPIGRLLPIEEKRPEEKMEVLQDEGVVEWSGKKFSPQTPAATVRGGQSVADLLLEDRR